MWARKYRPKTFEEVVGQDHAVATLKESVDRANTFILSGPSGVGKTTLARIYGEHIDSEIIEINGADNNGVDDVRGLTTMAVYSPSFNKHRMFIIDECFHASTKVTMSNNSIKPISTINVGDRVKNLVGDGVVTNVFKNTIPLNRLVLVRLSNGQEILTTKDHLFFTKDGWVEAQHLQEGEKLYEGANKKRKNNYMCDLPQRVQNKMGSEELLKRMQEQIASKVCERISSIIARITNSTRSIKKNVDNKSNVKREKYTKNDGNQETQWNIESTNKKSWWKWENNNSPTKVERCFGGWVCTRIGDKDSQNESGWLPTRIQSRPRISKEHVGDRGGWQLPSLEIEYSQRLKENTASRGLRVESIEIYESTSRREYFRSYINDFDTSLGYVELFDLEVSNHPSYYVENVLVHNCHQLTTQAWNALLKVLEESPKSTVWVMCTTEPSKIPATVHSRAVTIRLKRVKSSVIRQLIETIIKKEGLDGTVYDSQIMSDIITKSNGRVREALTAAETYVTTGVEPNGMTTLDVIRYITNVYNANIEVVNKYHENLDNEDVKAVANFITNYISFLLLNSRLRGSMPVQSILATYTTIDPFYLDDLRVMQTAIYTASKTSKEPVSDTIATLYNYYDRILSHYNDFRDTTESFKIATLTYMAELDNRG